MEGSYLLRAQVGEGAVGNPMDLEAWQPCSLLRNQSLFGAWRMAVQLPGLEGNELLYEVRLP